MATTTTKPDIEATAPFSGVNAPAWPRASALDRDIARNEHPPATSDNLELDPPSQRPSQRDALQALLAFSALHEQVRRRRALAARRPTFDAGAPSSQLASEGRKQELENPEFENDEQFVLDEVLQLVAARAVAITGADGLAIALAENNEIVLRASAGTIRPDVGARIDRDSAFSGACFRTAQIVSCDDTETDTRVNLQACRRLGARSMVAVPLCGRRRVIGVLEAFSSWPFAFNESDVRHLTLLAELVLGALKPEDEDRFAESAQVAATKLDPAPRGTDVAPGQRLQSLPAATTVAIIAPPVVVVQPAATPPVATSSSSFTSTAAQPAPVAGAAIPLLRKEAVENEVAKDALRVSSAATILDAPAIQEAPNKSEELEVAVASEIAESPVPLHDADSGNKPFLLILMVCIVIGAVCAGGVWWKMKNAQLGTAMIQPEEAAADTRIAEATKAASTNDATSKGTETTAVPSTLSTQSVDEISDATDPNTSPATAQELSKFPRVAGVRHWSSADSSTVVLDLEDQVQYEAHRLTGPDRIYFDLHDTRLAPELAGKSIDVGDSLLSRIRIAQPVAGMTRIVLETKANTNFSVSLEPAPYRLVVEVRKVGATPKGAVNLFPNAEAEKNKLAIVIPPPTKEDLQLRSRVPKMRIVVDAGHGGWDLGTVGRRGLLEKDLVLEIAQRLGKLLEGRLGMEVIYTRQDDNYIPLDERAGIANQAQADLFVSVHANYSDLPSARGVETYYTNFFSAPGSKDAAKDADTRVTAIANGIKPVTPTLSGADLHERIEQSRRLAASVQRSLYGTLSVQNPGLRDRGIKEAGFVVLTESAMPGILAEVSFVSSPTDEQKLRSDGYREQIAEALYRGIARYAASSKGVKVAAK